jgi:hypothetical protein
VALYPLIALSNFSYIYIYFFPFCLLSNHFSAHQGHLIYPHRSLMSDSDNPFNPPVPAVLVENTDTEGQGDQSDVNASNTESSHVKTSRPRLKRSYSKNLNSPSDGRKFHTIHSSDGAKFFNLENQLRELQGTNKGDANNPGSERQLTVETAVYRDQPMFSESRRPLLVRRAYGE